MDKQLIAHELWAAAQLAPGEGIEDGANRIATILERIDAERGKAAVAWWNGGFVSPKFSLEKDAAGIGDYGIPLFLSPTPTIPEGMALVPAKAVKEISDLYRTITTIQGERNAD